MHTLIADVRYALRGFAGSPGFTIAAVLSLAIGIGANTAIFSVASALLLHPLPYKDAERLVILWNRSPGLNITQDWFSTAQYFDIRDSHQGFEQLAIAITSALRQMKSRVSSGVVEALVRDAGEADAIHIHWYDSDADTCGDQADDG